MRGGGQGRSCHCQGEVPPPPPSSVTERCSAPAGAGGLSSPLPLGPRRAPRAAASAPGSAGRGGHSPEVLPIVLIARPQLRVVVVGRGRRSGGGSRGKAGSRTEPGRRRGAEGASSPHRRRHLRCCLLLPPLPRRLPGTRSGRRRRGAGGDPDVGGAGPGRGQRRFGRSPQPRPAAARSSGEGLLARLPSSPLPRARCCRGQVLPGQPRPSRKHLASKRSKCGSGARCASWGGQGGRPLQEASLLGLPSRVSLENSEKMDHIAIILTARLWLEVPRSKQVCQLFLCMFPRVTGGWW